MKKAFLVLVALGSILALSLFARRAGQKMSTHCAQMVEQCKQMAAERREAVGKT